MAKNWVSQHLGEETGSQILISLLIPFGAYLLAEHLHCSGILAAVAVGVTMGYVEQTGQALAVTRVRPTAVWDTVQFAAKRHHFRAARRTTSADRHRRVSKLVNARRVFESWVMLSALDVLDTVTTIICYCNETCSLALNINVLVHINYD